MGPNVQREKGLEPRWAEPIGIRLLNWKQGYDGLIWAPRTSSSRFPVSHRWETATPMLLSVPVCFGTPVPVPQQGRNVPSQHKRARHAELWETCVLGASWQLLTLKIGFKEAYCVPPTGLGTTEIWNKPLSK